MKKIVVITMAFMALSFMLFAQQAERQMKNKPCPDCKEQDMKMMKGMDMQQDIMKDLKLTKEQKQKIEMLRDENKKFMNTKKAVLENLRIDKRNAMKAENYTKVKQLNKSISDAELEIANKMTDHHQSIVKELTAEQKEKMQEMRQMHMGMMGKGMMQNKKMMKGMEKPCMGNCE